MLFGSKPTKAVSLDTRMIHNMIESIKNKEDPYTFAVEFPKALEKIFSDDCEFEIVVSN